MLIKILNRILIGPGVFILVCDRSEFLSGIPLLDNLGQLEQLQLLPTYGFAHTLLALLLSGPLIIETALFILDVSQVASVYLDLITVQYGLLNYNRQ